MAATCCLLDHNVDRPINGCTPFVPATESATTGTVRCEWVVLRRIANHTYKPGPWTQRPQTASERFASPLRTEEKLYLSHIYFPVDGEHLTIDFHSVSFGKYIKNVSAE